MILFYLILPIVILAVLRFLVALFNYLTNPYIKEYKLATESLVSILIPARNEEKNIENLLVDLLDQTYSNIEVLVYDDQSTDSTSQIVLQYSKNNRNISLVSGMELPEGWLGKNFACYNLAQKAKGDYLLYLDADVRVKPQFIENSLGYMQHNKLALLSFTPYQITKSFGERITVPVMQWILLSLLPLRLVQWSKRHSLSAANGQMMMFKTEIYRKYQWHEQFKANPVEDISIARSVKKLRYRMATLLGTENDIQCRMYSSYNEAIAGFSKNVCDFFGRNHKVMIAFAAITTLGPFLVLFIMPFPLIFAYFFSVIMARMMVAQLSKQSTFMSVLLLPMQQFAFVQMVRAWMKSHKSGILVWKSREIITNK
ncbi:MAG: glycosyltransferase family 2 protein [Bacteroidales bacterium]|nr:glycosyltransferase family 2 protein [Bacteroidales bacterium]